MLNFKLLREKIYFYHAIFLIFSFFFIGLSIDFHFLTQFISGNDTVQWLNFKSFAYRSLFIWDMTASGRLEPTAFTPFIYNVLLEILYKITNQIILSINLYWILLVYVLEISFFYFYKIFFHEKKAFFAVIITFFNLQIINLLYYPIPFVDMVGIIALPVIFYFLYNYLVLNKTSFLLFIGFFQVILFRSINVAIMANILSPLLIYFLFNKNIGDVKFFCKKISIVWLISFMTCFMLIINLGLSFGKVSNNDYTKKYNEISLERHYMDRYNLLNIFRLTDHFSFTEEKDEISGYQYFDYSRMYLNNVVYIIISFIFFFLILWSINSNKKSYEIIILSIILIIFIFFAKSLNPPFQYLHEIMYSNNIYINFFRSGSKYFMHILIPIAVIIMLWSKKNIYFKSLFMIYVIGHLIIIMVFEKPIAKYWITKISSDCEEVVGYLDGINDVNKILILPISIRPAGEMNYIDGYSGASKVYLFSQKYFINNLYRSVSSNGYSNLLNEIQKNNTYYLDFDSIDKWASDLNYRYILLEKKARIYTEINSESAVDYTEKIKNSLNSEVWNVVFENNEFIVYRNINYHEINKIFVDGDENVKISFQIVSPVKYNIQILNFDKNLEINFLESFHKGWGLYLDKISKTRLCDHDNFNDENVEECDSKNIFFEGNEFSYLYKRPVFENTHAIKKYYANGWKMDPAYIKKNFSKDYYEENSDGSINIELTLYFRLQSYFYFGLLVSCITLFYITGYLLYKWRKNKSKDLSY